MNDESLILKIMAVCPNIDYDDAALLVDFFQVVAEGDLGKYSEISQMVLDFFNSRPPVRIQ